MLIGSKHMNVVTLEFKKCCQCGARATKKIELVEVDEQGVTGATLVKHFCEDHGDPLDRDQLALLLDVRDAEIERLHALSERYRQALIQIRGFVHGMEQHNWVEMRGRIEFQCADVPIDKD